MIFDFSGLLGLLILTTFPCLLLAMGQGVRWTVQGQRILARTRHDSEGLQEFWGGIALLLLALFLFSIILSLHATISLLAGMLLMGAITFFLSEIALCVYWTKRVQENMW